MLVWSMCEWSDFFETKMCECSFGQCAKGPIFTTSECASGPSVMCKWKCASEMECASASLVNVRVVRFFQHRNVRVLVWTMCEWSGYNVGVNKYCASAI